LKPPDIASPRFKADPFPFYARLRAEAPVSHIRLSLLLSGWLVTRYDDVLLALRDPRFSKNFTPWWYPRPLRPLSRNILTLDPPDHTRLRALVNTVFTPRMVERLAGTIQRSCDEILDSAAPSGGMELVRRLAFPLPLNVIADLLGVPKAERGPFESWSSRVAAASSGNAADVVRALPSAFLAQRYLRQLVARRRVAPGDDLVTALVQAEEQGDKLSADEIVGMVAILLIAGYETTAGLIASGVLALLQNPDQRERLAGDPGLAESAVEELLRYTSPADVAVPRIAREEIVLGGVTIRRGDVVLPAIVSANRDEARFPHADALDLARSPNKHLAFGMGPHFCLGAPLARLETAIALTTLLRRFPRLRLAAPAESLPWRRALFFRGLAALPVAW
jgi:cytochrome P450